MDDSTKSSISSLRVTKGRRFAQVVGAGTAECAACFLLLFVHGDGATGARVLQGTHEVVQEGVEEEETSTNLEDEEAGDDGGRKLEGTGCEGRSGGGKEPGWHFRGAGKE
ncbi:hypothetical protein SLEP1_g37610 [Rubroshorea leprosula]|nr:hypothetical protein SLEP1_g37610 [Rubroshorea leprosula]